MGVGCTRTLSLPLFSRSVRFRLLPWIAVWPWLVVWLDSWPGLVLVDHHVTLSLDTLAATTTTTTTTAANDKEG